MATQTVWTNPSDSNDKIIFNDDTAAAAFYRFLINTGFECTLTRDQTNSRSIVTISAGTYAGILQLNSNGQIWSNGDLTLLLDKDNNGSNNLIVKNGAGTTLLTVDETGVVTATSRYRYLNGGIVTRIVGPGGFTNLVGVAPTDELVMYEQYTNPSANNMYARLRAIVQGKAVAHFPFDFLPNGAILKHYEVSYRKVMQAPGKNRNLTCWIHRSAKFGLVAPNSVVLWPSTVQNTYGSTETGKILYNIPSTPSNYEVVDTLNYNYGMYLSMENTDTANTGADGIGLCAFQIIFEVSGPGEG